MKGWESLTCERPETVQPGEGKAQGISPLYINACRKGAQRTVKLFSVTPSDRQEQKLKHGRFPLNTRKCFFTLDVTGIGYSKRF